MIASSAAEGKRTAVLLLLPTRGGISVETHIALTNNVDVQHFTVMVARQPVDQARNQLARHAIAIAEQDPLGIGPDGYACLWVDDDAWWPQGTISGLLAAHRQLDVWYEVWQVFHNPLRYTYMATMLKSGTPMATPRALQSWFECMEKVTGQEIFHRFEGHIDDALWTDD